MKILVNMRSHDGARIARFQGEDIEGDISGDIYPTDGKEDIGGGGDSKTDHKFTPVKMSRSNWLGTHIREVAKRDPQITRPMANDSF